MLYKVLHAHTCNDALNNNFLTRFCNLGLYLIVYGNVVYTGITQFKYNACYYAKDSSTTGIHYYFRYISLRKIIIQL